MDQTELDRLKGSEEIMNKEQMNKYSYELMVKNNSDEAIKNLLLKDKEIERLHSIIKEAIEYINEMTLTSDGYANYGDDLRPEHIIDILKGSDK